ncbi:glycoside hydrolase family 3 C-terminal domain-containing protein [Sphingomonas sp. RP10(2022)]|uniref:Glycoside hydrolase family 3 C-terminal domain-containing protein n=1 Tax=Sphingomonas liriopis TaxID=2949094 RepID=A0A9X2HLL6_9SPHN|nr:glycoside hydrolase family 3 C-terminal domain-containing protein [Sphingomonas liriopis]MCP3733471.1 glycoside hydrolase family 3 C-terminal domain-containing protein [Sphingomonas liriopis]
MVRAGTMRRHALLAMGTALTTATPCLAQATDPDARAAAIERQMTDAERVTLTHGIMAIPFGDTKVPTGVLLGAGRVEGIPRLGVPALTETDASLGVAYIGGLRGDGATALPSGLAMGATWDPALLRRGGATIAGEAQAKGFNVLLGGGINLVRDPRGGRNFEYLGEDPLHSGLLGGAAVAGIQSRHVLATVKHFAINAVETGRQFHNAIIGDAALRMSDLLAFEIAIERGNPGSVMCAYNRVNGASACGNDALLNGVLKRDWGYKGFVMSDWGAVHGLDFALKGLDQQSGAQLDARLYFGNELSAAARRDPRYATRLTEMNRRILRAMFAVGVDAHPPVVAPIDFAANARVAQDVAEQGIVLLRNRGVLPLAAKAQRIAVIGGYADSGVLSGGGSSQVQGVGGPAVAIPTIGGPFAALLAQSYQRSSPLAAIKARAPKAEVVFRNGRYIADAVIAAKQADVAIVFATQWMTEGLDAPDLSLPEGQDALIAAVAQANPNTIVVLETGSQVLMPWLDRTAAVIEAWYPGARGGEAIAAILFGDVNPSGRLPVTFPASVDQLPRPKLPGSETLEPDFMGKGTPGQTLDIDYDVEGADVGYRWFARRQAAPLFPFGFGLSYTSFAHGPLTIVPGPTPVARFTVTNTGKREGAEVGQVYLTGTPAGATTRLVGFSKVQLKPGERRVLEIPIEPRVVATWQDGKWTMAAGTYTFATGHSATDLDTTTRVALPARRW